MLGRRRCTDERDRWIVKIDVADADLAPRGRELGSLPIGEQTDAVGARHDLVEVLAHGIERQPLVDVLAHVERGGDVERERRDDAERTEVHDETREHLGIVDSRELPHLAGGGDELERRNRRGEDGVGVPRAVGSGGACSGNRDVGERRKVGEGKPFGLHGSADVAVACATRDGHRLPDTIEVDRRARRVERDHGAARVGDGVERVPRAEHLRGPKPVDRGHDLSRRARFDCRGEGELVIPRPVPNRCVHKPVLPGTAWSRRRVRSPSICG